MFKVVQINSVCGYGSTGRIVTDIHSQLIKNNVESVVIYGRGNHRNIDDSLVLSVENKSEQAIHLASSRIFDDHGLRSKNATKTLIDFLERENADLYHLHNIHGYYLNYPLLFEYLESKGKPVVWTLHDCWSFTGHCAYFDYVNCEKWKVECHSCPERGSYPASFVMDKSSFNFKKKKEVFTKLSNLTIVTPSYWLKRQVEQSFLREFEVEVIPNGIDLSVFTPTKSNIRDELGIDSDTLMVIGVANIWERRKGLNDFLEIAEKVGGKATFVIVGLDKKQLSRLPGNVIGLKRTNSVAELVELYTAADIFLNTTLEDNFPTTNLEAQACGTFGITYKTGGSPEAFTKDTGLVVEKGDVLSVVNFLISIDKKELETSNISKLCERNATKSYSHTLSAQRYLTLYRRIMSKV